MAMIKALILFAVFSLQLIVCSSNAVALDSVTVTVTIPTKDLSDVKVMAAAKNKAVIDAMETLPSVVWGSESIKGLHYSEYVRSISFAYADVTILKQTFDRLANTLTIQSSVSWDENKIKTMLSDVSEGEKAKNTLNQITELMKSASLQDYIKVGGANRLTPLEEATLLASPHFFATSLREMQTLFMATVYEIAVPMTDNLLTIADATPVILERADNQYLYYKAVKPKSDLNIQFTSQALSDFYQNNESMINEIVGQLCFFSVLTNEIYKWDGFLKPTQESVKFRIDTQKFSYRYEAFEKYYEEKTSPLEVFICSDGSMDRAITIRRLEY